MYLVFRDNLKCQIKAKKTVRWRSAAGTTKSAAESAVLLIKTKFRNPEIDSKQPQLEPFQRSPFYLSFFFVFVFEVFVFQIWNSNLNSEICFCLCFFDREWTFVCEGESVRIHCVRWVSSFIERFPWSQISFFFLF